MVWFYCILLLLVDCYVGIIVATTGLLATSRLLPLATNIVMVSYLGIELINKFINMFYAANKVP